MIRNNWSMFFCLMIFTVLIFACASEPATPQESCLSTAKKLVSDKSMGLSAIEAAVPIEENTELEESAVLCKGIATISDGQAEESIQFFETSTQIAFETLHIKYQECDDKTLISSILNLSKSQADRTGEPEIIKIYEPKEISNTGDRLLCSGEAKLSVGEENQKINYYMEADQDNDLFFGYEPAD